MDLSPHFTIEEFTNSDTAARLDIDNNLPIALLDNARATAAMLERIRGHLGSIKGKEVPIVLTSGYRCPMLNKAIGSTDRSDHIRAQAADFKAPAFATPYEVCKALAPVIDVLGIGQLIYEHTWVHVSTRTPDKVINRIITVAGRDYVAGIIK
jgi:zinc D-Ala-D-Ala carboxypeptidase